MLLTLVVLASVFGIVMIASATGTYENSAKYLVVQIVSLIIGIIFIFLMTNWDFEYFGNSSKTVYYVIYAFNILALILVLFIGKGKDDWGGQSWIRIGGVGIQPSELVKIGFIITFAKHLELLKEDINLLKSVIALLLHAGILILLILKQPDYGTAMVFCSIFIGMLFVCGIHYKYILASLGAFLAFAPVAWFFVLSEYQKKRFMVFFNPESDKLGAGYHVFQSKIAVGSGELFGKGLFKGIQTQRGFLPEKHTDFIFSVIGEELGLIGSILVLVLLLAIIWRCIVAAQNAKDDFGAYVCVGVASMFIFHTFENIGMCIGLTPVTGIPLPFISYGGSALLTNLLAIGLVINVQMRRRTINF